MTKSIKIETKIEILSWRVWLKKFFSLILKLNKNYSQSRLLRERKTNREVNKD